MSEKHSMQLCRTIDPKARAERMGPVTAKARAERMGPVTAKARAEHMGPVTVKLGYISVLAQTADAIACHADRCLPTHLVPSV
jgi:hypothetical protein